MVHEGLSEAEARSRFWLVDRHGLLHTGMDDLPAFQQRYRQPLDSVRTWQRNAVGEVPLVEVVRRVRPTVLIGVTGQAGAFTEEVVRAMAAWVDRPILFPLSNPTSRSEAVPVDLIEWTEGRALIATGSPFGDVVYRGRTIPISQCNNSFIFPGVGLGVVASSAGRVTDEMFLAAAQALSDCSPAVRDPQAPLLPSLTDIRAVSRRIAVAVGAAAQKQGLAEPTTPEELERRVVARQWEPRYPRLRRSISN
jgi:malate dehydrogenase (oxaloacetate-decarboxylating)